MLPAMGLLSSGDERSVSITDTTVESGSNSQYRVANDGFVYTYGYDSVFTYYETWLLSGSVSNFQVQVTKVGDSVSGPLGSWVSPTQTWAVTATPGSARSATLTVKIRDADSLEELDTATVQLIADNL